ncbi:MAG TPA: PA14 domain-containing protein [Chloroflexia bacterium]|nr:PA14 domain-containing protein [Chloroflexia bacterium]
MSRMSNSVSTSHTPHNRRDHVSKPISPFALYRVWYKHLRRRKSRFLNGAVSCLIILSLLLSPFAGIPLSAPQRAIAQQEFNETLLPPPPGQPTEQPWVDPQLPSLTLDLTVTPGTLSLGDVFTVTLSVRNQSAHPAESVVLTLPLPVGAVVHRGPQVKGWNWQLASLAGGASATRTATLRLVQLPPGEAVVARAQVSAARLNFPVAETAGALVLPPNLGPSNVSYLPGAGAILRSPDGKIEVQVPPDAADRALTLQFSGQPGSKNSVPPHTAAFKRSFPTFYLNATDAQGKEFHHFSKPLIITFGYTPQQLEALGYTQEELALFWFDESASGGGEWLPLATNVDTKNRRLTAYVDHFSTFTAAEDFRPSDQFLPSLKDWQVGLFRGNVQFEYELEVPDGPDENKPEIKLNYDSSQTDGLKGLKQKTQSSWVGKGWSLDTGYIAYNKLKFGSPTDPGHYSLVLDGKNYDLMRSEPITGTPRLTDPTDYAWRTTDESFNRIRATGNGNSTSQRGGYNDGEPLPRTKWVVWTKDGTRYEFAEDAWWGWSNCGSGGESPDEIEHSSMETYKWHLSKVEDTHGNIITYTYGRKSTSIQSLCGEIITGISDYDVWPSSITWGGTRVTGANPRYKVEFTSVDRTIDTESERPSTQLGPEVKETQQLEEVLVKSNRSNPYDPGTSAWELVRRYDLKFQDGTDWHNYLLSDASSCDNNETLCEPISSTKKLTLQELRLFGSDNISYMPPITFTYWLTRGTGTYPDGRWNRLYKADNNQGGVATFEYETIAATMGTATWAKHYKNNRRVTSRTFTDGRGNTYVWSYQGYQDPAYNSLGTMLTSNDSGPNQYPTSAQVYYNEYQNPNEREEHRALLVYKRNSEFRGHSYVKEIDPNGNAIEHWFYQGNLGTQGSQGCYPVDGSGKPLEGEAILTEPNCFVPMRDREFLKGKEYKTVTHQGAIGSNSKMSEAQKDFSVSFFEYGDTLEERLTGLWRGFSFEKVSRDIAWERGSVPLTKTIEYDYDVSQTGVITYGNLISTKHYAETGAVLREITHTYKVLSDTTSYIADRKRDEGIKDGQGRWLAWTVFGYDGSYGGNEPLTKGDVTLTRKYYDLPLQTQLPSTAHSSDMSTTYDLYGNKVGEITYEGYGVTTVSGGTIQWGQPGGANPVPRTKSTLYDANFNVFPVRITETIPSLVTTRDYDFRMGTMTRTVEYNNVPTDYTYDYFGRNKTQVKYGDSAQYPTAWIDYYDFERPVKYVMSQRETAGVNAYRPEMQFYDGMGREIQNKKESKDCKENIVEDKRYDGLGNLIEQSQPRYIDIGTADCGAQSAFWTYVTPSTQLYRPTKTTYDTLGRKLIIEEPDPTISSTMQYAVIDGRKALTSTDALKHMVRRDSDMYDRLTAVREYSGTGTLTDTYRLDATTLYAYSPLDLLTTVTDTYSKLTTVQYDSLGRKTQLTDPVMGTWQYQAYDPSGNLKTQRDNRGLRISFSYDAMDRLTGKTYPDGGGDTATYTYDGAVPFGKGQRTSMSRASGTNISWEYDQRGRKVKATHTIPGLPSPGTRIFQWGYDSGDRTTTITYPAVNVNPQTTVTEQIRYEFDAGWRQVRVCTNATQYNSVCYANDATFTPLDQPISFTLHNGLVQSYQYTDPMMWLLRIKVGTTSTPGQVFNRGYSYQPVGNVSTITKYLANDTVDETQNFTYDQRDRLTRWTIPDAQQYVDETYTYDRLGNILTKDKRQSQTENDLYTYVYDYNATTLGGPYALRNVQVTRGGSTHNNYYTYDANGNTDTSDGPSRNRDFTWNTDNQPTRVQVQGGGAGVTEDYIYDADGERAKRTRANSNTYYAEGLWEEEIEGNNNGATTVRLMYKFREQVVAQRQVHPNRNVPKNGLRADYYNNSNLTNFQTTIYSPTVDYDWRTSSPHPAVEPEGFSVEWVGTISTDGYTGSDKYNFSVVSDGGVKLWVDNQLLIDSWTAQTLRTDSEDIVLAGGQQYSIKLQFSDGVGTGRVQLQWQPPGASASAVISTEAVTPPTDELEAPSDPNSDVMYLHGDHLGSISVVTDYRGAQGQPQRQEFDPWGLVRNPPGPPINSTSLNYTAQRLDGTDLLYYHARYYDPRIGRFMSPDSIVPGIEDGKGGAADTVGAEQNHKLTVDFHEPGFIKSLKKEHDLTLEKGFWFQLKEDDHKDVKDPWGPINPQALNRYSYVLNNPVRYTDPTGHILPLLAAIGIGLLSGVALDVGIDFVTDNKNFDFGTSVGKSLTDPLTYIGAIPGGQIAKLGKVGKAGSKIAKVVSTVCSFSDDTAVMTDKGPRAISALQEGDLVLAYDEESGTVDYYPVLDVLVQEDPVIEYLTIDGEQLETTPEHPFYTQEERWIPAGDLWDGAHIRKADGSYGVVQSIQMVERVQEMYNLTVGQAHTFFVGDGQWLVHNQCQIPNRVKRLWRPGTWNTVEDSITYHYNKHGAGRNLEQYTLDALRFFRQNRSQAVWGQWNPKWAPSYKLKIGNMGGYFTHDGRVLTFWYK